MAKDQGPLSGFRDMLSAQTLARQQVLDVVTAIFERYGFMPIKTPAIERFETLQGKYGQEATALIYDLKDRGDRHLALRYDHTVPLARLMATHGPSLPSPYKRYVVGDVWRGESPQAGRYREFTQIDTDIVGTDSFLAECEILTMMRDVFKQLEVKVTIEINDRRILDGLAEISGISEQSKFLKFIGTIDKVTKIGVDAVLGEIESSFGSSAKDNVARLLANTSPSFDDVQAVIDSPKVTEGLDNLKKIFSAVSKIGLDNLKFNPSIARGLNYYTSTIYETIVDDIPKLGSVCSGGRYDNLMGQLGGPDVPAVGTSIGLDRLMDAINTLKPAPIVGTKTQVYIVNLDESLDGDRLEMAQRLRDAGIPTELYYKQAKLSKQLETIAKLGVDKVLIYGPKEATKNIVIVRSLANSSQEEVSINSLIDYVKNK
ncbi:MAG: histidine--tRNA ligase [Candidatus Saccharimonadales bacterium]